MLCNLRGGDYRVILPPDEDETRACVTPEEPAGDAGKTCSDGRECIKSCACPDDVANRFYELREQGASFDDPKGKYAPKTRGRCTERREDIGFINP